jgi:mannose-6-phosphate isomerase-like protein (cupin superfamily)
MPKPQVVQLDELPARACPCGTARRAFADEPGSAASAHVVEIKKDSAVHYHRKTTEIYVVLEGSGQIELDGVLHPIKPLSAVYIPPGCRHRAIGALKILNIPVPAFDPRDEFLD